MAFRLQLAALGHGYLTVGDVIRDLVRASEALDHTEISAYKMNGVMVAEFTGLFDFIGNRIPPFVRFIGRRVTITICSITRRIGRLSGSRASGRERVDSKLHLQQYDERDTSFDHVEEVRTPVTL